MTDQLSIKQCKRPYHTPIRYARAYLLLLQTFIYENPFILDSRLKSVKGGTSKKDLINSLSEVKEDCIARLVTNGQRFESEEEAMLAANPVIRHIAPHLQVGGKFQFFHFHITGMS